LIGTSLDPFLCVTAPCGPYTPSPVNALLTQRSSYAPPPTLPESKIQGWRDSLHSIPTLGELIATDGPPTGTSVRYLRAVAPAVAAIGISEAENREIDNAAEEQALRAQRIEQLAAFKDTIHPDRLLDIAGNIAEGQYATVPIPPRREVSAQVSDIHEAPTQEPTGLVHTPIIGPPIFVGGLVPAAGEDEPDLYETEPEEQSMDLSSILGAVSQVADIYQSFQPPQQLPPVQQPSTYPGSIRDWVDGPFDFLEPSAAPVATGAPMAYSGGCISNRDRQIAAASGVSAEAVDRVLHYARQGRRRRRRMLTKSDIGDISTMKQILGNGEAFKLWLAKATR